MRGRWALPAEIGRADLERSAVRTECRSRHAPSSKPIPCGQIARHVRGSAVAPADPEGDARAEAALDRMLADARPRCASRAEQNGTIHWSMAWLATNSL